MSDQDVARDMEKQANAILFARMREAAKYVTASVRAAAPFKTGKLRKSIKFKIVEGRTRIGFRVRAGQYARFLDWGTRNKPRKDGKPSRGKHGQWHIQPTMWFEQAFLDAAIRAMDIIQHGK